MKGCDIVVTNPPFSLWREFLAQILSLGKKFLIIGTETNLSTVSVFSLYKDGAFGLGKNRGSMDFSTPDGGIRKFGNICWYQNLDVGRVFEDRLWQGSAKYRPENYERYSNLDILFVRRVKDIPVDYDGLMGVPVSYLPIWNKEKHELVARIHDKQWLVSQGVPRMGEEIVRRVLEQGNASHFSANMVYPYLERDGKIVFPFLQIVIKNTI